MKDVEKSIKTLEYMKCRHPYNSDQADAIDDAIDALMIYSSATCSK